MNMKKRLKLLERDIVEPIEMFEKCVVISEQYIKRIRKWSTNNGVPMHSSEELYNEIRKLECFGVDAKAIMKRLGIEGDFR